ncbi:MAG: ATP-dependent zinc metalloprotease FtsH [Bacilli bacterium]|nr:ATP-dependent zinc metalloprotease FtsH [Bacilli bacterium]
MEEDRWNEQFTVTAADGTSKTHSAYSDLFISAVDAYKNNAGFSDREDAKYIVNDAFETSWWDAWGPTVITVGVTVLFCIFLFARLNGSVNGANRQAMDFNKSPARREDNSKVRFSDVAGCDEEKAEMVELVEYLKDPKKYSKFGAKLPKGVLLMGPPGTGKTLLAKAVAGEANVPFYSISGSDFVEMFVGVGAGRVRDLFKKAKQTAPCLIFIDEIDAVGRQRGAGLGGGNDEREQTLNQLLVEMDGFEANKGVLVIAATNRSDVLDPALLRAGRFDRSITVSLPDKAGREAIFKVHARNKKIDPAVDFGAIAKRTVGFSGADIENILNEAAILAVRENKEAIDTKDIDEAIDRRIAGPAKSSKGMNAKERKQVAYHEAGHAVIGLNLPYSDKVQKITIIPRGQTGGHVLMTPEDDRFLLTKNELIARITGLLGGRTSEEIFFDDVSSGASNDIQQATRLARLMVTEFGMSELGPIQYEVDTGSVFLGRDYANTQKNFSTQVAYEIDKAVREIIEKAHANARKLLEEHKDQVILVAETLLEQETITAEEIESLVKTGKLPGKGTEEPTPAPAVTEEPVKEEAKAEKPATPKKPRTSKAKKETKAE